MQHDTHRFRHYAAIRRWIGVFVTIALLVATISHTHACGAEPQQAMEAVVSMSADHSGSTEKPLKQLADMMHCHGCISVAMPQAPAPVVAAVVSSRIEFRADPPIVGAGTFSDPRPPKT